ncbi:MAG: hypothetical protein RLZ12_592 [Bacillota bacterium]|jgi:rubrerythrin
MDYLINEEETYVTATEEEKIIQAIPGALRDEAQAINFYSGIIKNLSPKEMVRKDFHHALHDEMRHYKKLKQLYYTLTGTVPQVSPYTPHKVGNLKQTKELLAVLKIAIHDEQGAKDLYAKLSNLSSDAALKRLFKQLSQDEQDHLHRFERNYLRLKLGNLEKLLETIQKALT